MTRRGFTLVELLVAMTVMAIFGVALARMLMSDSRFVTRQEAMLSARGAARAGVNAMGIELRMAGDSGLRMATADSVTVRVPYTFGIACQSSGTSLWASLMPVDSVMYAGATPAGYGWRNSVGDFLWVTRPGMTIISSTETTRCTDEGIVVIPGGSLVELTGTAGEPNIPPTGSVFNVFQLVTYGFAPSADLPGRTALWRRVGDGTPEEIAGPFEAGSGFAFLVGTDLTEQATPPADLGTVRGLRLRIVGASEFRASGDNDYETFELVTDVSFVNRRAP